MGHGIAGIHHQVHDDVLELKWVGMDNTRRRHGRDSKFDVFADQRRQHLADGGDDGIDIDERQLLWLFAAEGQELRGKRSGSVAGFKDSMRMTNDRFGISGGPLYQFRPSP